MFTLKKANQLLNLCLEGYSSLEYEYIEIIEGSVFSVSVNPLVNEISIVNQLDTNDLFYKNIEKYLDNTFNLNTNSYMFYDFVECFSFLHEVGHIYYKGLVAADEEQKHYSNYKAKVYNSYKDAFIEYRNIPTEQNADHFACNMLKNNKLKIWSIMQEISIEEAKEELEFWSM